MQSTQKYYEADAYRTEASVNFNILRFCYFCQK